MISGRRRVNPVIISGLDAGRFSAHVWFTPWTLFQACALAAMLILHAGGVSLGSSGATAAACAAILLFGLPHGALDLEIISRQQSAGPAAMVAVLILYLGFAASVAALWSSAPVAALTRFIIVAVVHFAEDWCDLRSAFLAQCMAIAILTAPTLLHLSELEQLFIALSGREEGAFVANIMLLLAPVSTAVACVCLFALWHGGRRNNAVVGGLTLSGMIFLPPVIAFALFFCLYHSPKHLSLAVRQVGPSFRTRSMVLLVTIAALGIAAVLFVRETQAGAAAPALAASFITLSILTVPHMIVPPIAKALGARAIREGRHLLDQPSNGD